jgi:hypothetical protein
VAQDALQHHDVTAVQYEVAGEGVAQDVGKLSVWQL